MVDKTVGKCQGQRKKRSERESCLNNIQLNVQTKERQITHRQQQIINNSTYTKSNRKHQQLQPSRSALNINSVNVNNSNIINNNNKKLQYNLGSLDNISSNPWGEIQVQGESSLRRSRSLAISREVDIYTKLDVPNERREKQRRSQLIPRAKLIEKTTKEHRYLNKGKSLENIYSSERNIIKRKSTSITPPDYTPPTPRSEKTTKNISTQNNETYNSNTTSTNNNNELDSLDSNYYNKTSINTIYKVSYEDLSTLNLPNYYPDSKCDTDNTDNISLAENSSISYNVDQKQKFASCDNIYNGTFELNEHESISYDENIVLSTKRPLYDSLNEQLYTKPKTIRGPTPYRQEDNLFKPHSLPNFSLTEHFSTTTTKEETKESKSEDDAISIDYFETNSNFDEIKLSNDNIPKDHDNNEIQTDIEIDESPLYAKIEDKVSEKIVKTQEIKQQKTVNIKKEIETINKTCIEIQGPPKQECEEYKTVVTIDTEDKSSSEDDNKSKSSSKNSKQHSHNYLKEFLESQKGSKKPLQNFIAKKFSNLSRRNSKENGNNLVDNQFHSLPDISITQNLRKCEKIDRKLRKCEKINLVKSDSTENRFIVNIGRHFDITANSNIPVDFEVKIAKIPKKFKEIKKHKQVKRSEEQFIEAVKNLKETLNSSVKSDQNQNLSKPEVIALTTNNQSTEINIKENKSQLTIEPGEITEITMENSECTMEYQEKLGTMRRYWKKILNGSNCEENNSLEEFENDESQTKCKVVEIQTKVDEVKRKFEPKSENESTEKPPNKVQMVKHLFEPKISNDKGEKMSPLIKETCSLFENPFFENQNQFESLNPNAVEIVDKIKTVSKDKTFGSEKSKYPMKKDHKPLAKSASAKDPEFDHIRYRVVKSDLFQKNIFANCEKESQFDGLMQYLQDFSFQELLIDNNIVIIEPIRSKVPHEASKVFTKVSKNVTPLLHNKLDKTDENGKNENTGLRKHFFYHPIRVNKEVNDDELPNPDTVKQARQFFEGGLKRSISSQDFEEIKSNYPSKEVDPDKDRCSATDSNSNPSNISDFGSQEYLYDSINGEHCCEQQYVSEDILEKIREHGTTVTYYGGRVVRKQSGQPILTRAIMEEIKSNERKIKECSCRRNSKDDNKDSSYNGVKFKLLKSNSCSSRLELVGTDNLQEAKKKYLSQQRQQKRNGKNVIKEVSFENECENKVADKNAINECIKNQQNGPKIIAEEKKMVQWKELNKDNNIYSSITINNKHAQKVDYDYHNYEKVKVSKCKKIDEMEFEPYEVAS